MRSPLSKITLALWTGVEDNLRKVGIYDANSCHLLVGGTTGGGNRRYSGHALQPVLRYSPDLAKVPLISIKRSEFPDF